MPGTGRIDEASVDPLEVLICCQIALVGMQSSYLTGPLALFLEPEGITEIDVERLKAAFR